MEPLSANDPHAVGGFQLRARLGAGGMGRVYLGFSPAGRAVAVKVVHSALASDPEFTLRFAREVAAARAVSGMYTAPVVATGLDDDPPWLATTFVPGPSLAEVVVGHGPLPEPAVWRLGAGLAEALQAIHACGLVHRDLKPANVLLAGDGPRVIDFGISRALDGTGGLTATGMVVGTPGYMSPEQARGDAAGPASDVFSLGCLLAYAAAGTQPFGGGNPASVLYRIVTGTAELDGVPGRLRDVLANCLAKEPAQRPALSSLAATFAREGPGVAESLASFWPDSVAEAIRLSVPDFPSAPVPAYAQPAQPASSAPASSAPAYTPTAVSNGPGGTSYPPSGATSTPSGATHTPSGYPSVTNAFPPAGQGLPTEAAVYAGPSYGTLPPPGHVPGVASPRRDRGMRRDAAIRPAARGRPGAPALASVLFALDTIVTPLVLFAAKSDRRIDILAIAIWVLGLVALVLVRTRNSRTFFDRR